MNSTKKIVIQGVVASAALMFVGVTYNALTLTASAPLKLEPVSIEVNMRPMAPEDFHVMEPRERAIEEHGEPREGTVGGDEVFGEVMERHAPPDYERERKRLEILHMDRTAAIKRADELHRRLEDPALSPSERMDAEEELDMVLDKHFEPAAGEPEEAAPPEMSESAYEGLDINNIFNKVWGLFQGVILAWVGVRLGQRKKEGANGD